MASSQQGADNAPKMKFLNLPRYNKEVVIPGSDFHDELTISYADLGRQPEPGTSLPTVLFIPGMFGTRFSVAFLHPLAEKMGVRLITADRFGLGKSTDITALEKRIPTWVEIVPKFLAQLGVEHVALVSHSAGTLYLLNTLYSCRDILNPQHPFVTLLAPWVGPAQSRKMTMRIVQMIPNQVFGIWNRIPKFLITSGVLAAFDASGALLNQVGSLLSSPSSTGDGNQGPFAENRRKMMAKCGFSLEDQEILSNEQSEAIFREETVGANSEALLCLGKCPEGSWGKCQDFHEYLKDLAQLERIKLSKNSNAVKLKVDMYFAESDALIGNGGKAFLEACWNGENGEYQDAFEYEATTAPKTDHDTVTGLVDIWERIFIRAGGEAPTE